MTTNILKQTDYHFSLISEFLIYFSSAFFISHHFLIFFFPQFSFILEFLANTSIYWRLFYIYIYTRTLQLHVLIFFLFFIFSQTTTKSIHQDPSNHLQDRIERTWYWSTKTRLSFSCFSLHLRWIYKLFAGHEAPWGHLYSCGIRMIFATVYSSHFQLFTKYTYPNIDIST